jgi:pimeloyl-ACP methyl ester carboxylesterase
VEPRVLTHDVQGSGEPVVLVPGGLTGWVSWVPHAERLAERWTTVRVQPIHNELGSAGHPGVPGYTAAVERESLRMTLDALGLHQPHLAGWSAGGNALLGFVLAYPERVRSLTLIEPGSAWVLEELGEVSPDVRRMTTYLHGLFGRDVTEDDLASFLELAGFVPDREVARDADGWERWVQHRMALSWYSEDLDRAGRSVDRLPGVRIPVLLVKGASSTVPDRRVVDVLAERLPNATSLELPGDHASHIESIDGFLEAFEAHLAAA